MKHTLKSFAKKQWQEWRGTLCFVVFILIPVKSSLADWNWVPTGSMNPTIVEGDLVYINKLAYDLRFPLTMHSLKKNADPESGEIAVFFSPDTNTRMVKRVIGTPGDVIELRNNALSINGKQLSYQPLSAEHTKDLQNELRRHSIFAEETLNGQPHAVMSVPSIPSDRRSFAKITVPEGHYFVMGDNRDNSKDSRYFGFVERKAFVGEATRVIASLNKLESYQPRFGRFFKGLK